MLRRLLHPLYRRLETDVHPLRYVFLEVTQRCNLACRHCGSDCSSEARFGELSMDDWLGVADQLARDFEPRSLAVVLTGGEPLCCPELDRLLERLQANRLAWGVVTNGWLLTEANVERLSKRGIASATVSLDGLRDLLILVDIQTVASAVHNARAQREARLAWSRRQTAPPAA
jgi:MoaA/NifB/PqqE/SkfB family radical SAM enzyme